MRLRPILVVATCAAAIFAPHALAQQSESDRKMCASFESVRSAISNFETLGPDATVEEAEVAADRVETAVKQARKAAEKARPEETARLHQAVEELEELIDDAPDDATLGQIQADVQRQRAEVRQRFQDLVASANCPNMRGTRPTQPQGQQAPQ